MTPRILSFAFLLLFFSIESIASHVLGGQVHVRKIDSVKYAVDIEILHDATFFTPGPLVAIGYEVVGLDQGTKIQMGAYQATLTNYDSVGWPPYCGPSSGPFLVLNSQLSDTIIIPFAANGYSDGIVIEAYGPVPGFPIIDSIQVYCHIPNLNAIGYTNQQFPKWPLLKALMLCRNQANSIDLSAIEPDGDSMFYEFFDPNTYPGNGSPIILGTTGYFNKISSSPPIVINPNSGLLTGIPINQGHHMMGQKILEYRNGNVISESYRSFPVISLNCPYVNTAKPETFLGQSGFVNSTLIAGVVTATSGSIEIPVGTVDPDSNNVLHYQVSGKNISSLDLSLQFDSTISNNMGDTMSNRILVNLSTAVFSDTISFVANNTNCFADYRDTLFIPVVFQGHSNAGNNNTIIVNVDTASDFDMFPYLGGNPIPGGTWVDFQNNGLMTPSGVFWGSLVSQPATYKARYEQQNPGYPVDKATLTIEFIKVNGLGNGSPNDIILYPNPADKQVTISSKGIEKYQLISLSGKIQTTKFPEGTKEEIVPISDFPSGVYQLKVLLSSGLEVNKKLVIQH